MYILIKRITLGVIGLFLLISLWLTLLIVLSEPRNSLAFDDPYHQEREMIVADSFAVVSGTPWATDVAIDILNKGGNAVDAAIAGVLMLNVTFGEAAGFPGVAPVMYYNAAMDSVMSYIGAGTSPEKATIDLFKNAGHDVIPQFNIWAQLVPASPDVLITLLQDYGTMSFTDLVSPAIERANEGFPVHHTFAKNMNLSLVERIGFRIIAPTSTQVYFGKKWWLPLKAKDEFKRPLLAKSLQELVNAEQNALVDGSSREASLEAVRDYFYKGPIAKRITDFHQKHDGLISPNDLATYTGGWERPIIAQYGEYTIYCNQTWSQAVVLPLTLNILKNIDLPTLGHNTESYVHTVSQAINLAMADRYGYIADPTYTEVPLDILLSSDYGDQRRQLITDQAFKEMAPIGEIPNYRPPEPPKAEKRALSTFNLKPTKKVGDDTSQIIVTDKDGNTVAITPSDFPQSPMIPNTGLTMGIRMTQFSLDPNNPNALKPGKRPRITPHAAMVFKNGEFYMAFNTPGGDMQAQALVQVFLNVVEFGMDPQQAIDAYRFRSKNFPDSFNPESYKPGLLALEQDLYYSTSDALINRGHQVELYDNWDNTFSSVGVIIRQDSKIYVGSDPRESTKAAGL